MKRFHLRKQDPGQSGEVSGPRYSRAAFASALTVFMLGTFASFGGLSYAASSAKGTVETVHHAVAPAKKTSHESVAVRASTSAAADQYGEQKTVKPAQPLLPPKPKPATTAKPSPAPQVVAAGAGAPPTSGTLPFTGFGLALTAAIGSLLLALGLYLRRNESRS